MPAPDRKRPTRGTKKKAGKAGAKGKATPARAARKAAPAKAARKAVTGKAARKTATGRPSARTPATKQAAARRPRPAPRSPPPEHHAGPDPEGFFVARVRGEDAVRDAPHQLQEPGGWEEEAPAPPLHDEGLGELPWTYGGDLLMALPRDPRTLFVYWDQARATVDAAFAALPGARVQLWIFAQGAGWERVRVVDVALEARGWYLHELEPGRTYRAELHLVAGDGRERLLQPGSNATALPPQGPSPLVDDRYASLSWDVPLPALMGPGVPGGPFSEEARALLARLSGWDRFGHSRPGDVPTSPAGGPTSSSGPPGGKGP